MVLNIPPSVYERESQKLVRRLMLCDGYVNVKNKRWSLYSRKNQYRRPLEKIEDWLIDAMRARGHLVERPEGGLIPLAARQAHSGRFSDARATRPEREAGFPGFHEAESPLLWLRARKLIDGIQFEAGERLRADYERACLERRITTAWDVAGSVSGNGAAELSDQALAARQRFAAALDGTGPELAAILVQICCLSAGLEQAERLLALPPRSGKAVLGLGLMALARHYGFVNKPRARPGIGTWAATDYRPAIAASD